jgi:C-terminal processing protease CtpA/Prc
MKKMIFPAVILLAALFSCDKKTTSDDPDDDDDTTVVSTTNPYKEVNAWILDNMEVYYLWNDYLPSTTNNKLTPDKYFESLLYTAEDRFSWIQENYTDLIESLAGISTEPGYDFQLFILDNNASPKTICGVINYVKPASPASETILKRGDVFIKINGKEINMDNYTALLDEIYEPHTLEVLDVETGTRSTVSFNVAKYEEPPILLDSIYNFNSQRIGYLVYNFFAEDNGSGKGEYVRALNSVFGKFRDANITDLILDLRYNSGGALSTASGLSSMIANRTSDDLFLYLEYNQLLTAYFTQQEGSDFNKTYFFDEVGGVATNKVQGLNRVYILTSGRTASASEVVINGLKPYMDVILLGETTYGKNVGSVTIYETDATKQKKNKWGMQPIVVKLANKNHESNYADGFTPDIEVDEYHNIMISDPKPIAQLGDINETMLEAALIQIGVLKTKSSPLRSAKVRQMTPVASSLDRRPERNTVYIDPL